MSVTPREGEGHAGGTGDGADAGKTGLRERLRETLRSAGRWLSVGFRRLLATESRGEATPTGGDKEDGRGTAIRVGGQRRLTGDRAAPPTVPRADGGSTGASADGTEPRVEARLENGRLRVYDADRSEAYVDSDYWEEIRQ